MGLLSHASALRSGKSYEDRRFARGHDINLDSTRSWDLAVLEGAGGWRSTAADMVRFIQAVQPTSSGPIRTASTMAMTPRFPTGAHNMSIGLGWHAVKQGNRSIVWHNGETGGYHAFIGLIPETGANVVVLSNAAIDIDEVGLRILDPSFPLPPRRALPAELEVPDATLDRYVGRYRLAPTFDIEITRTGDRLYAQATGQARFRVRAASPTRFYLTVVDAEIEFIPDGMKPSPQLILHQSSQHTPGNRTTKQ